MIKVNYSPTYLKTINNQLSAIFNYAVRYYDLKSNPCAKAGSMGKSKAEEMDFWTGEEFRRFIDSVMNKRLSVWHFMTFCTGQECVWGEHSPESEDVDLERGQVAITKIINVLVRRCDHPPKTSKSKESDYIQSFWLQISKIIWMAYMICGGRQVVPIAKYYLEHEMQRGIKSGVKRIKYTI